MLDVLFHSYLGLLDGTLRRGRCLPSIPVCAPKRCRVRVIELIVFSQFDNIVHDALIWKVWDFCHVDMMIATVAGGSGHFQRYLFRL